MEILFQDEDFIAVNKPSGLLVHRSQIDRSETRFALQLVRDMVGKRVYPVHRLDKPTSGVLMFALSGDAAREMIRSFSEGRVHKRYLAVVRGHIQEQGIIDHPLVEELDDMTDRLARRNKPGQPAVTLYRCLGQAELPYPVGPYPTARYSLVQLEPATGRKHQIRRHMKHIFHPVVGDTTHGDGKHNAFFRSRFKCRRLLLAATHMAFAHPRSGGQVSISAPLDGVFQDIVGELGWGI